jgi:hypothetical protein
MKLISASIVGVFLALILCFVAFNVVTKTSRQITVNVDSSDKFPHTDEEALVRSEIFHREPFIIKDANFRVAFVFRWRFHDLVGHKDYQSLVSIFSFSFSFDSLH